jgi:hypothetical protein
MWIQPPSSFSSVALTKSHVLVPTESALIMINKFPTASLFILSIFLATLAEEGSCPCEPVLATLTKPKTSTPDVSRYNPLTSAPAGYLLMQGNSYPAVGSPYGLGAAYAISRVGESQDQQYRGFGEGVRTLQSSLISSCVGVSWEIESPNG